jgi:membrane-associated phospholipid phosphatase
VYRAEESLEQRLLLQARTRLHGPRADRAVAGFSALGEHAALWFAIGIVGAAVDSSRRARWSRALQTVGGVYALNTAIKSIVRRPRPKLAGLPPLTATATGLSFPSAHSSTSFAGAVAYGHLGLPRVPLLTLAASMAVSRLYLGVHYPSDVLAGAVLGAAVAQLREAGA